MNIEKSKIVESVIKHKIKLFGVFHIGVNHWEKEMKYYNDLGFNGNHLVWIEPNEEKISEGNKIGIPNIYPFILSDKMEEQKITIDHFWEKRNLNNYKFNFWKLNTSDALILLKGALNTIEFVKSIYLQGDEVTPNVSEELNDFLFNYGFVNISSERNHHYYLKIHNGAIPNSLVNIETNVNNNYFHLGRFGNLFFTALAIHFIALKNDLATGYKDAEKFSQLGIDLFVGKKTYFSSIPLMDDTFYSYVTCEEPMYKNVTILNNVWCQTREFSLYLKNYFWNDNQKNKIISKNFYKNRYNNNNDVYIHVRLGDIVENNWNQPFEYYDKILSNLKFDNGFISSDSIQHPICERLIKKYKLNTIILDEVKTIMLASTCKHIVLSTGTFSWMIGLFCYFSENIFYPKSHVKWHGEIFVFPEWTEVDY